MAQAGAAEFLQSCHSSSDTHVQTALHFRKLGNGRGPMAEVSRAATEDLTLEQLHLELRAGMALSVRQAPE